MPGKYWYVIPAVCFAWCAWVLLDAVPNHGKCGKCGQASPTREAGHDATQQAAQQATDRASAIIRIASDIPILPAAMAEANQRTASTGIAFQIVSSNATADVTMEYADLPPGTAGGYTGGRQILIARNYKHRDLAGTVIHECVHAGGYLRHDSDPSSLMYSGHGWIISDAHVAALRSLAGSGGGLGSIFGL